MYSAFTIPVTPSRDSKIRCNINLRKVSPDSTHRNLSERGKAFPLGSVLLGSQAFFFSSKFNECSGDERRTRIMYDLKATNNAVSQQHPLNYTKEREKNNDGPPREIESRVLFAFTHL